MCFIDTLAIECESCFISVFNPELCVCCFDPWWVRSVLLIPLLWSVNLVLSRYLILSYVFAVLIFDELEVFY